MNAFDAGILRSLNQAVGRWPTFDSAMVWVAYQPFVKGCVFSAVLWALWCGSRADLRPKRRAIIIATIFGALAAEFLARAAALTLPFRLRPLHDQRLDLVVPPGVDRSVLDGWSAFPSDHAVLFAAVSVGVLFACRCAGVWLLAWTLVVISLPRIYVGLHHPTDILAGLMLGGVVGALTQLRPLRETLASPFLAWEQRHPLTFYAFAWYLTYELARLFEDFRFLLSAAVHLRH